MDMGMGIVHVVRNVHVYTKFSGISSISQCASPRDTVWKSSSMSFSSASRVTYVCRVHLEGDYWKVSV